MQHKCNRKLKGKKYPAHQIARKKRFLMTRNHPHTTPPPHPRPQELNGRSLSKVASYFRRNVPFIRKGLRLIFLVYFISVYSCTHQALMNHLAQSLSLLYRIKLIFITGEIGFFSTLKNVCEKPGNIRRCLLP